MLGLLIPVIAGGAAIVLVSRRASARGGADSDDITDGARDRDDVEIPDPPISAGRVDVRDLALRAGAPAEWADFFSMCSYGESKQRALVGLGIMAGAPAYVELNHSTGEAKAAARTYKRNAWLKPCWKSDVYSFGSGGLFGMLPAAGIAAFKNDATYRCVHPWSIFDAAPSMVYAAWFARRLQGWSNWTGTVISMRAGWGNPSRMGKPPAAKKRAKWGDHCQSVGLPPSFLDKKLPAWKPAPAREIWAELGAGDSWLASEGANA